MMNKTFLLTGILALSSAFVSAQNSPPPTTQIVKEQHTPSDTPEIKQTMIIGPKRIKCMSINQTGDCYQVKFKKTDKKWENFSQKIEGFKYQPGFEYVIEVKLERDLEGLEGNTEKYIYVRTISKKKSK
ncbi:DUF4377 domain-containing protein [Chryseobacterium sp. MMS23-Vi53]|uniref:DUF4377 domain-containing protein n=1 Tax=Chryseobacterium sp. MMS23-Vi53 TaxID=3386644 RepID=UPI0039E98C18